MHEIICEGKTVEQAIKSGMDSMNIYDQNSVDIEVLQEAGKSVFGLLKPAKVKLSTKEKLGEDSNNPGNDFFQHDANQHNSEARVSTEDIPKISLIRSKISEILNLLNIEAENLNLHIDGDTVYAEIKSLHEGLLIGKHGQTLEALQYIITLLIKSENDLNKRIILDVGQYRKRHKSMLEKMALKVSEKVVLSHREAAMEAMSPFDRRTIHLLFKDSENVKTYSQGEGKFRRIVIAPK